jgi:hypothetical protein
MKHGHTGHLNIRNKFSKEVFPKYKDFPSNSGWTKKPRFLRNEEKIHEIEEARAMDSLQG